jgi:hypothetical protein
MDVSRITEIRVTLDDGKVMLYKDKGIEKFKRQLMRHQTQSTPVLGSLPIAETECEGDVCSVGEPSVESKNHMSYNNYGYSSASGGFNYKPFSGNPYDAAVNMQKSSGLTFK